jgi:bacterial/archaeal transporter family protein
MEIRGERSMTTSWVAFAIASAFFAGLTAFFGKLGVASIDSDLATFIRTVIIAVMTIGIVSARHAWKPVTGIGASTWLYLACSGVATGLSWLCYYRALQLGPVSKVAPLDKLSVVFAILLGIAVLGEALTWQLALGGSLIVAGAIVMVAF